jgi:plastocyanin
VASKNTTYLTFIAPFSTTLFLKEHPEAKATVSVSTTAGTTCGMTPTATVMLNADYTKKDHYSFMPTQVTIKKGQSVRLSNLVDQALTFVSTPDPGLGTIAIYRGWEGDLQFTTEGTYTISCVEFPNLKFTVTVQGT